MADIVRCSQTKDISAGRRCFLNASQSHRITQEEIFGPVVAVQTFRTPEEAIEKANNTPYGLSGGVWTDKGSKIFKMTTQASRRRHLGEHLQ